MKRSTCCSPRPSGPRRGTCWAPATWCGTAATARTAAQRPEAARHGRLAHVSWGNERREMVPLAELEHVPTQTFPLAVPWAGLLWDREGGGAKRASRYRARVRDVNSRARAQQVSACVRGGEREGEGRTFAVQPACSVRVLKQMVNENIVSGNEGLGGYHWGWLRCTFCEEIS